MYRTVRTGTHALAQGRFVRTLRDGRIEIDAGNRRIIGTALDANEAEQPSAFVRALSSLSLSRGFAWMAAAVGLSMAATAPAAPLHAQELLNVSYDPTRELYREYNELFAEWWTAQGNPAPTLRQSHGGSGGQARAVVDGLEAGVVTLALAADIDTISSMTGKIPADWQTRLPHNSSPYTSTIVFLVREGNPKDITDWDDLVRDDVEVITPNPKTSGGARWNFMAGWAWALKEFDGDETQVRDYMGQMLRNVPVLDTGARGATNTFVQRGLGDVLLAWENEAFLALAEQGEGAFDIIVPSVSILAEPPVSIVDGNLKTDADRALATAYLEHLYSPEAQALALKHYYRAWDTSAATAEDLARFPALDLVTIDELGGWAKVQPDFFGNGGIFDQIYEE
ncbi:sulfate-binding protein [Ketogulonicigenium robustum]|uniref:Sulfate-binding protein n=1 Tax=Ketogulonicigenium robustum TaxID=92947 RepID=A0A1W6NXI0_9RHOB|nr:sulfate ABC transporter substrate-binding protein [Ketogulonicigenium robustum]ARO13717.1 sulfate-binding protein [Ketogulonicigenium robustum]